MSSFIQEASLSQPNRILRVLYMISEWADCIFYTDLILKLNVEPSIHDVRHKKTDLAVFVVVTVFVIVQGGNR